MDLDIDEEMVSCEWDEALSNFDIEKAINSINNGNFNADEFLNIDVEEFLNTHFIDNFSGECCTVGPLKTNDNLPLNLSMDLNDDSPLDLSMDSKFNNNIKDPQDRLYSAEVANESVKLNGFDANENIQADCDVIDLTSAQISNEALPVNY